MLKKEKTSDQLMLSLEDFPVSRGQSLEKKVAQKTIETSGPKCLELLKTLNQDGLSERMSKALLTWNWVSPVRSLTWKTKTLPSGHLHMVLSVSKLRTKDKGASLWPTPRATKRASSFERPSPSMIKGTHGWSTSAAVTDSLSERPHKDWWNTPTAFDAGNPMTQDKVTKEATTNRKGRKNPGHLKEEVLVEEGYRFWPTARAAIGMNMRATENMANLRHKKYLETEVAAVHIHEEKKEPGGVLNPDWVEWLMGFETGWTDIDRKKTVKTSWEKEPKTPRITHKKENRAPRLKALGNAVVPQMMIPLGLAILEAEKGD